MPVRIWQANRQAGKMPFNRWVQGLACQGTSMFMKLEHQRQFLPKNVKTTICAVSGSMDAGAQDNYLGTCID